MLRGLDIVLWVTVWKPLKDFKQEEISTYREHFGSLILGSSSPPASKSRKKYFIGFYCIPFSRLDGSEIGVCHDGQAQGGLPVQTHHDRSLVRSLVQNLDDRSGAFLNAASPALFMAQRMTMWKGVDSSESESTTDFKDVSSIYEVLGKH